MTTSSRIGSQPFAWFIWIVFLLPSPSFAESEAGPSHFMPRPGAKPKLAPTSYWVGHHAVFGSRKLPLLGELEHRTDSYVLAAMQVTEHGRLIEEWPCDVTMQPVLGIRTRIAPSAFDHLPATSSYLRQSDRHQDGPWHGIWQVDWRQINDIDQDGYPGLTVTVDAPLCGGQLYMASKSTSTGILRRFGRLLLGEMRIEVHQTRLGASNACLRLGSPEQEEIMQGISAYAPVDAQVTCASLRGKPWPIDATAPQLYQQVPNTLSGPVAHK